MPDQQREPRDLSFADLIPVRDTITDTDSAETVYELRSRFELGANDMAIVQGVYNKALAAADRAATTDKEDVLTRAALEIEGAYKRIIHMLIIDMPTERIDEMSVGQMRAIFEWWSEGDPQPGDEQPEGDGGPGEDDDGEEIPF